jgi:hypothetical protein
MRFSAWHVLALGLWLCAAPAGAQDGRGKRGRSERSEEKGADAGRRQARDDGDGDGNGGAGGDAREPRGEEGQVRKDGDTEVKTMEFSGLDIEGQLKTPQMLYFLERLRAEFGRPRLPHRSFMPELQRSAQEKALK